MIIIAGLDKLLDIGFMTIILRNELGETMKTAFVDTTNRVDDRAKCDRRFKSVYNEITIYLYEKRNN